MIRNKTFKNKTKITKPHKEKETVIFINRCYYCPKRKSNRCTWWFTILADSLWISRSSWSANNFAFIAAAARPALAAALTFSESTGVAPASFVPQEPCPAVFSSEVWCMKYWKWERDNKGNEYEKSVKSQRPTLLLNWICNISMSATLTMHALQVHPS